MHLSIIIPTRDRLETLRHTLDALAGQQLDGATAELLVIDDGSRDGTAAAVEAIAPAHPLTPRVLRGEARGASAARNLGLRAATGEAVLFLGDDTAPADARLLAAHAALHARRPEPGYAVLGRVAWAPTLAVTPLMRWLELHGQFVFATLAPGPARPEHFYTAHLSAKRALLLDAGGFDERLPFLFEDADLGARLATAGLELDYHPELVVHHDHAITLAGWIERQERAGGAGRRLRELRGGADPRVVPVPRGWRWVAAGALARIAGAPASEWRALPAPLRDRLYSAIHAAAYARGYRSAAGG